MLQKKKNMFEKNCFAQESQCEDFSAFNRRDFLRMATVATGLTIAGLANGCNFVIKRDRTWRDGDPEEVRQRVEKMVAERLGTSTCCFSHLVPLSERELDLLVEHGIKHIEIGYAGEPHFDHTDPKRVAWMGRECHARGIQIDSMHCLEYYHFLQDEEKQKKGFEIDKRAIDALLEMGGTKYILHVGVPAFDPQHQVEASIKSMETLLNYYRGTDLRLCVENGPSPLKYREFADMFNSDKVGVCIDTGHAGKILKSPDMAYAEIAGVGDKLFSLHLHDHDEIREDHRPPFEGQLQWQKIFEALFDIGYDEGFVFEVCYVNDPDPLEKIARFPKELAERWVI